MMSLIIPSNNEELLQRWLKRLRESQMSHYEAAKPLSTLHIKLGTPVILLTAIVGSAVFISLAKETAIWVKIITGFLSVAAAVLSGLQTFLKYSERAEKHRTVAAKAGAVRREIEQYFAAGNVQNLPQDKIDKLRQSIDKLFEDAPNVPQKIWDLSVKKYQLV